MVIIALGKDRGRLTMDPTNLSFLGAEPQAMKVLV
jgi:hypothetical protein